MPSRPSEPGNASQSAAGVESAKAALDEVSEQRLRAALPWGAAMTALTVALRVPLLPGGLAHPLGLTSVLTLAALAALHARLLWRPLPRRWRGPASLFAALAVLGNLGLRSVADDLAPADWLTHVGPLAGVLWASQLALPRAQYLLVVSLGAALTVAPWVGPASIVSAPFVWIAAASAAVAALVRWGVVRDARRRRAASLREERVRRDLIRAVKKLSASESRAREVSTMIETVTREIRLGLLVHDEKEDRIVYHNDRCCELWGLDPETERDLQFSEILNRRLNLLEDPAPLVALQQRLQDEPGAVSADAELELKDGRTFRYFTAYLNDEEGQAIGRLHAVEDITATKRAADAEIRYGLAAQCANDGLFDWRFASGAVYYSDRWKEMLGYRPDEIGDTLSEATSRLHPKDRLKVKKALIRHLRGRLPRFQCEFRMRTKGGEYLWVLGRGLALRDVNGRAYRLAGSQTDITHRKLAEMRLRYDAEHDALTGLHNRTRFFSILSRRLEELRSGLRAPFAALFFDLDRFKVVNDSLGHAVGDELLVDLSSRLRVLSTSNTPMARLGGDEFAMLLPEVESPEQAMKVAEELQRCVGTPVRLRGQQIVLSASIGLAWVTERYSRPEEVLRDADAAMYHAKERGGSTTVVFRKEMHQRALRMLELQTALLSAVEKQSLDVAWQPIFRCGDLSVVSVEALARWRHARLGEMGPGEFIPLAEEIGCIGRIDAWVFERACENLRAWRDAYRRDLQLAVNLSALELHSPELPTRLEAFAQAAAIRPEDITLELTESGLIENLEQAEAALSRLAARGFRIALDDFGTGYSSLNYIRRLPINVIKIAGSLADDVCTDPRSAAVTTLVIETAHALGLEVVGERVQSQEQFEFLRDRGCDFAQGFYLGAPVDATGVRESLASGEWLRQPPPVEGAQDALEPATQRQALQRL